MASALAGTDKFESSWEQLVLLCATYLSKDFVNGETGCWSFEQAIAFAIVAYMLSTE